MNATRLTLALLVLLLVADPAAAQVTQTPYQINPGGTYEYKPSPEGPGIPGGMPSDFELDFGIGGTFIYEFDVANQTARLLDLNLVLAGNEAIQTAPPAFGLVTADRVETYLASHLFVEDFIGGLVHLESSTVPGLKLTDALSGNVAITGGYDHMPADGEGVHFMFSAVAVPVPEQAAIALVATAALALLRRRR